MQHNIETNDEDIIEETVDDEDSKVSYEDMYRMAQYMTYGKAPTIEELRREINGEINDDTINGPSLVKEINYSKEDF